MTDWQPIETAPRDGTAIWILLEGHPYIGYCEAADGLRPKDTWFAKASFRRKTGTRTSDEVFGCYGFDVRPEGWMPLPPPPSLGRAG